jgi:hypothetical protein
LLIVDTIFIELYWALISKCPFGVILWTQI